MQQARLRSPLANVRGLGSAKQGAHHWWVQRLTSLALVPLCIWFIVALCQHILGDDRSAVADWFSSPYVAITMLAFTLVLVIHCALGLQVIIEDYVHREFSKIALLLANKLVSWVLGLAAVFSVAKLHFIGL